MVYLSRIYTKSGDAGQTGLGDGSRVEKHHPRVCAYGEVDELNAVLGVLLVSNPTLRAQTELQKSLKDLDLAPHWIYDDLPRAMAEAKATGKPLLVVLRCVPCPPGKPPKP